MKKIWKYLLVFIFVLLFGLSYVKADCISYDDFEIEGNSYIIGTHLFTSDVELNTRMIMLASKTIDSDDLSDMIIYYKDPFDGTWVDALTGEEVDPIGMIDIQSVDLVTICQGDPMEESNPELYVVNINVPINIITLSFDPGYMNIDGEIQDKKYEVWTSETENGEYSLVSGNISLYGFGDVGEEAPNNSREGFSIENPSAIGSFYKVRVKYTTDSGVVYSEYSDAFEATIVGAPIELDSVTLEQSSNVDNNGISFTIFHDTYIFNNDDKVEYEVFNSSSENGNFSLIEGVPSPYGDVSGDYVPEYWDEGSSYFLQINNLGNIGSYFKVRAKYTVGGEVIYSDYSEVVEAITPPAKPILVLDGPNSINSETDIMSYQLNIYLDDFLKEADGVELSLYDDGVSTTRVLDKSDVSSIATVSNSYNGEDLVIGKQYHTGHITFESEADGEYTIRARAFVLGENEQKIYSAFSDAISINAIKTFPSVEITNEYSNPDYVSFENGNYTYRLGIDIPDAYAFTVNADKFGYIVFEENSGLVGTFSLSDKFDISVPENSIKRYSAQLGYYDKNGEFVYFNINSEDLKYFVIDTRKLTAPTLNANNDGMTFSDLKENGSYLSVDVDFYTQQPNDSLDYNVEGAEFYKVSFVDNTTQYQLISNDGHFSTWVLPTEGYGYYAVRVYATNLKGERVYSDYSDVETVVRVPEIEVSEVQDGKVNISIVNASDFSSGIKYKVWTVNSSNEETALSTIYSINDVASIDVEGVSKVFVKAFEKDYESSGLNPVYVYSPSSNEVTINN